MRFCRTALGRILIQFDFFDQCDHFAIAVVATRIAYVVRTLEFSAICTFIRIGRNQAVMSAPLVAT